jgi:hypothetical protein
METKPKRQSSHKMTALCADFIYWIPAFAGMTIDGLGGNDGSEFFYSDLVLGMTDQVLYCYCGNDGIGIVLLLLRIR